MSGPKKTLPDRLTQDQLDHLSRLTSSVSYESMTISFSLDGRDATGTKKSCFYSLKVGRGDGDAGWLGDDMRVVQCLVSKEVVATVYHDAVRRRMMGQEDARDALMPILASYDCKIAKLLGATDD